VGQRTERKALNPLPPNLIRKNLSRLDDAHVPIQLRLVVALVLLYAMCVADVLRLQSSNIEIDIDDLYVRTRSGKRLLILEPTKSLLREVLSRADAWLFPSPRLPGQPMSYAKLRADLRLYGFEGTLGRMRQAAVQQVLSRVPAALATQLFAFEPASADWLRRRIALPSAATYVRTRLRG
jgi:integrase